jgi:hypothetical protein
MQAGNGALKSGYRTFFIKTFGPFSEPGFRPLLGFGCTVYVNQCRRSCRVS